MREVHPKSKYPLYTTESKKEDERVRRRVETESREGAARREMAIYLIFTFIIFDWI